MKRIVTAVMVLAMAASAMAKEELSEAEKAEKRAAAKERMMQTTGGLVEKPGMGKIAIVNCQDKISGEAVQERVDTLRNVVKVKIELITGENVGAANVLTLGLPDGARAAVYIVDDPILPMSLVAAEAGWGVMNVAQLKEGKQFKTEFNRVAIMTFGAGVSQFKGSTMQTVRSPHDLNRLINEGFTFDGISAMMKNLQNAGVTQSKRSTYKKACEEGWAAEPENEYQRAIWEKVKAEKSEEPVNGLRIKPGDKPKGK